MKLLAVIGMTAVIGVTGIGARGAEAPALYPNVGIVTEVDTESDTVYWSDGNNEWYFYGVEDWMVGDGIAVIMSDEGTESVKDDRMIGNPRYISFDGMTESDAH